MSTRADITQSAGWYRFEDKTITITVTDANGDPVTLTGLGLLWRVMREAGSDLVYLTKTGGAGISITGADNNEANMSIDPLTDYADLEAGIWRHELWDTDNNLLLSYGDVWLLAASVPA
jgi:hypothetical protein